MKRIDLLSESLEHMTPLMETIRDPLLVLDSDLRIIKGSHSFYASFKETPEETEGQFIYDLGNKQWDIPKLQELLESILPHKSVFNDYEVEHHFPTIGRRIMLLNARQIYIEPSKEQIILLAFEDTTDVKSAQLALEDSEERFRRLFETASDGLLLVDKGNGHIVNANQAIIKLLGYKQEEIIGMSLQELKFSIDTFDVNSLLEELLILGVVHHNDIFVLNKQGEKIDIDLQFVDKARFIQCNVRDITNSKIAEKDKKNLEEQLHQSQKMEAIGTMAGGIAHDFNNILTIISGNAELAIDDIPAGNPARERIKEICRASSRAKDLVRQILAFSRKEKKELIPIHPQGLIKETLKLLRSTTPTIVSIIQSISQDCGKIMADPTGLHLLLMNLFTNAVQSMNEEGEVTVSLQEVNLDSSELDQLTATTKFFSIKTPGTYARLSVTDKGAGMDEETAARIFDPFYTTKDVGKGTGMGLSVVHGIVESHGGFITVKSALGRGSTFHVFFPVTEEEEEEILEIETTHSLEGTERILFVDDETMILEIAEQMLKNFGYEVTTESSSVKALEIFKSNPDGFDLLITDQSMPNMSGSELVAEILKARPGMPIILCSGYSSKVSAENASDKGIRKYMTKPYSPKELAKAIREVLDVKL
jgi:PAS domain S-box-containing protein